MNRRARDSAPGDGCSFFPFLPLWMRVVPQRIAVRLVFRRPDLAKAACDAHDEIYKQGGTPAERVEADLELVDRWRKEGEPRRGFRWVPTVAYRAIQKHGGPEARIKAVSWAYGGERFVYDDEPADDPLRDPGLSTWPSKKELRNAALHERRARQRARGGRST